MAESHEVSLRVLATAAALHREGPRGHAWWTEAQSHAARTRACDNPDQWAEAVHWWRQCERPYDVAQCLRWQADAHLHHDQRELAASLLTEAHDIATTLGALSLSGAVQATARRARLPLPANPDQTTRTTDSSQLTGREREVLALLADGMTNRQIAQTLFMPPKTASVHVSHILAKLGVANRTEAAAIGRRQGLTAPSSEGRDTHTTAGPV